MTTTTESQPLTPAQIAAALQLIGLEFSEAEIEQMAPQLAQRRQQYNELRRVALDNSTPPALAFQPVTPVADGSARAALDQTGAHPPLPHLARPTTATDLAFATVAELGRLIHTGQVSAVELAELYLARIERLDPQLNSVVTVTAELALSQARQADDELRRGIDRGPLHGIPWGAKDLLATRGIRTTWGAEPFIDQTPQADATVVRHLAEAGAVLVAKLTTGALANGDIWFGGQTKNPWDRQEGSSGSSAGPGAATAAALVGFSIGTETMGSIISPSARCGITGLRPSFGRVSRSGCMALSWSMDKIGPMARSVEDCALVLQAIYGPDGQDTTVVDRPFAWPPAVDVNTLRIGYQPEAFATDRPGLANDQATLAVLRDLGAQMAPIQLPDYPHEALMLILFAEAATAFDELTRHNQDDLLTRQDEEAWPNVFRLARLIPAVEYLQANRLRRQLGAALQQTLTTVDLYLQPLVRGKDLALTNYTGHPAVIVPNGTAENGRPTNSILLIGRLYEEATLLAVAQRYQEQTDFHRGRPALAVP